MSESGPSSLCIAVLTYLRPAMLRTGLVGILQQMADLGEDGDGPALEVELLVIDNDPAGSAREVTEELGSPFLRYVIEPAPGISAARNRALHEASHVDLLLFIDDDEEPQPNWLTLMLATRSKYGAELVAGAVLSKFEADPDPWVAAGRFFDRRRLPTGTSIVVAATNNLLLDLRWVRRHELEFENALGLSGAEDTLFTRTMSTLGARMVWNNEAMVTDWVPASRITRRWVLMRALSSGNSWSLTSLMQLAPGRDRSRGRIAATAKGLLRMAGGGARYLFGLLTRSFTHQARGLRTAARGAGMVAGAFGLAYQEYARPGDGRRRLLTPVGPMPARPRVVGS